MTEQQPIAIIGAGWAGLSTAVKLAAAGKQVTVFEAAPNLGGRARSFIRNGMQLDNGQHILLGAYHHTLKIMRQVGVTEEQALLRLPLQLCFPGQFNLTTPRLPAPLHLLAGLLSASGLSLRERLAALRLMTQLRLAEFKLITDTTVAELLADQPAKLIQLLWEPLCLAALNTPIKVASAQVFLNVLCDSFSHARTDSDLLLPQKDLSNLFPQAAARFIEASGGRLHLSTPVNSIEVRDNCVIVNDASFSHLVCAVAPFALRRLTGHLPCMNTVARMIDHFDYQPIATVYLQYPASVTLPFPMLGLTGGHTQWLFDRGWLCGQHGLMACVISAEGPHLTLDHALLAKQVHDELQGVLGALPAPDWQQVIVEKRATYACTAGLLRPPNTTDHARIFIAGDYTAGDYPATLEAAVRSGVQCAQLLLAAHP